MEDCNNQCWDELMPEVLGLIFSHLSLKEKLVVIPSVCKSWRNALLGPYCWQEIDIDQWCRMGFDNSNEIKRMLQILIPRSAGSLEKLCVSNLIPDESNLELIAAQGKTLTSLTLLHSEISDEMVEQVVERFSALCFLDLSNCRFIGARAIEAFGNHCPNLTGFRRVMNIDCCSAEDEANAIAFTMHKLKHLEISYECFDLESVVTILENCSELEHLDVDRYWSLAQDEKLKKFSKVEFNVRPIRLPYWPSEEEEYYLDNHPYEDVDPDIHWPDETP